MDDTGLSADQMLGMVTEMRDLDQIATTWRQGPGWAYQIIHRSDVPQNEWTASGFPDFVQLHQDVWIAYEWNYHRTARIILHGHLLECLDRLQSLSLGIPRTCLTEIGSSKQACTTIIRDLVDEVLSTVPQSLGDIDREGQVTENSSFTPRCKGLGGYFLLWPIKMIKVTRSATVAQKEAAQGVLERIREYTGMKSALGELSSI